METESNPRVEECAHHIRLSNQRRTEVVIGRDLNIGSEYREMGCLDCGGENSECRHYIERK